MTAPRTRADEATAILPRKEHTEAGSDGTFDPRPGDGTQNPRCLPSVYFDWSNGPVHVLADPTTPALQETLEERGLEVRALVPEVKVYAGLDSLLESLTTPTRIRAEATYESFNVVRRKLVQERCRAAGHDFAVINPRATAKRRAALGFGKKEKSNEIDVGVIRDLANDGKSHFYPTVLPDDEKIAMREAANGELMLLRRDVRRVPSARAKAGFKFVSAKDDYADSIIEHLPDPKDLTEARRMALCTPKGKKHAYSKTTVSAVGVAARYAKNTREFDFITGMYQNGYPCQLRSDLMLHRWSKGVRGKLPFTDFRREVRWLFHTIRQIEADGTFDPRPDTDDGTSDPQPRNFNKEGTYICQCLSRL